MPGAGSRARPQAQTAPKQLPEYLADSIPSVLAYITSFFLVGTYWLRYYVIFHHDADAR
jgi:uncharacterized membrane protein